MFLNIKKRKKIVAGVLAVTLISLLVSVICCKPVESVVQLQRNLLLLYGFKEKKLKTNSGYLNYFEGGKGQTMILVHGYIAEAGNWFSVAPELMKRYNLVIPDMPGHGDSDPLTDKLSPVDLIDGIMKLIVEKSENEKVILVGHSLGGWISVLATLKTDGRVSALILENSAGLKTDMPERLLLPKDVDSAKELLHVLFGKEAPELPDFMYKEIIRYVAQKRFINLYQGITDDYFLDRKLKNISIPVYLIWGGEDNMFNKDYALRFKKALRKGKLFILEGTGHCMHCTKPSLFIEKLLAIGI